MDNENLIPILQTLRDNKAKDNNTIDLDAYVRGLLDAQKVLYTEKQVENAIDLARRLKEGSNYFDVENILGSGDGTYGISIAFSEKEIIKNIKK